MQFQLSDYVPADSFYRRLKSLLNLDFLYPATSKHYGQEGQKSIDPVVFMKGSATTSYNDKGCWATTTLR